MNESAKEILTKNNQSLKSVTYQDVYVLKDSIEQLQSWMDVLDLMKEFFSNDNHPLNKKKIVREFYAMSKIFNIFYDNFLINVDNLEIQAEKLGQKEKVKK